MLRDEPPEDVGLERRPGPSWAMPARCWRAGSIPITRLPAAANRGNGTSSAEKKGPRLGLRGEPTGGSPPGISDEALAACSRPCWPWWTTLPPRRWESWPRCIVDKLALYLGSQLVQGSARFSARRDARPLDYRWPDAARLSREPPALGHGVLEPVLWRRPRAWLLPSSMGRRRSLRVIAADRPEEIWAREGHVVAWSGEGPEATRLGKVDIATYKTPDVMLSSAQDYRPGEPGRAEHIWQATLGPRRGRVRQSPGLPEPEDGRTSRTSGAATGCCPAWPSGRTC